VDRQQHFVAVSVLADRQTRPHFPANQQAASGCDRDRKASLSVYVTGDVRR
jgi:hypothetical protein